MGRSQSERRCRVTAVLLVMLGSSAGASLRYVVDREIQSRHERVFPFGTLTINVVGSFCLGLVAGAAAELGLSELAATALGVGVLGGFTTFSTYIWETLRMVEERSYFVAVTNVVVSIGAGLVAVYAGYALIG